MWVIFTSAMHGKEFALRSEDVESINDGEDIGESIINLKNETDKFYPIKHTLRETVSILNNANSIWPAHTSSYISKFIN